MSTQAGRAAKTVVTTDQMKDLQMRAKAIKEERRNNMDGRHTHIFGLVAHALDKTEEQITEIAIADERWNLLDEFFKVGGSRKLMWYYQEPKIGETGSANKSDSQSGVQKSMEPKLFLTTGREEMLRGKCLLFMRLNKDKALTPRNMPDALFTQLDATGKGGVLQAISDYLRMVMMPHLRAQKSWGNLDAVGRAGQNKINQFLESVDRFNQGLESAQKSIANAFKLEEVDIGYNLDVALEQEGVGSSIGNSDFATKLEQLMGVWCKQIELVLTESEQMRKEADDIGPSAELDHWKQRMTKFNSLLTAISTRRVKLVYATLAENKSKLCPIWMDLDRRVSDVANEARDNVKYLSTLDQYLGPLQTSDPMGMKDLLPNLINSIRMIHTISRYYNTSERMTSLFVKVTNQMIKSCRAYIMQGSNGKVWDQEQDDLLERIDGCVDLKNEYQAQFAKAKDKLADEANRIPGGQDKHFDFSENYIFGKLENFCHRLECIKKVIVTLRVLSKLKALRVDGIDSILKNLEAFESNIKMRPGELDYKRADWDNGFKDFLASIGRLEADLQSFIKDWIEKPVPTTTVLEILAMFQPLSKDINLNMQEAYQDMLRRYLKQDLVVARGAYNKQKTDPPGPKNFPPVAARISWARQLFKRIDEPMTVIRPLQIEFKILDTKDGKSCIKTYNQVGTALIEYETMYHQLWIGSVATARETLKGAILNRAGPDNEYEVNFNTDIYKLCKEGRFMKKIGLGIPPECEDLLISEERLRQNHVNVNLLIEKFEATCKMVSPVMMPFLKFFITRMENALRPGAALLTWDSLNVPNFIQESGKVIAETRELFVAINDILECRIDAMLKKIENTPMIELPEEPVRAEKFISLTAATVAKAEEVFVQASANAESYVKELVELLESHYTKAEMDKLKHAAKTEHNPEWYYNLTAYFCARNTEAFVRCTRNSLDDLKRRLQQSKVRYGSDEGGDGEKFPLYLADITLEIPQVVFSPSLDDIQQTVNKIVDMVLSGGKKVVLWEHFELVKKHQAIEQDAARKRGEDKLKQILEPKPFDRQLREHKDVIKSVIPLNTIVSSLKTDAEMLLRGFSTFQELWEIDPAEKVRRFEDEKPLYSDYGNQIRHYGILSGRISEIPESRTLGPIKFDTDLLNVSLTQECNNWKRAFGKALDKKASGDMDKIFDIVEDQKKRLGREIKDLDDIRNSMGALRELRENEVWVEMTIAPIEESYGILNRMDLVFNEGNQERVDTIGYAWKNTQAKAKTVQDSLAKIQGPFQENLVLSVEKFKRDTAEFYSDFDTQGPLVEGIKPSEASDKVTVFQGRFDELWRKYVTYSGGEELFGMEVTDYPELQRISKELNLLQKLYSLYNQVLSSVDGYYEILWSDLSIEDINNQLLEFQARCRKLPPALKTWDAYKELSKKIDDFNECCPLLEAMSNDAMLRRHWDRIEMVTKCKFPVEEDSFSLRDVMDAPLLENNEDIEDICISAGKERDIESKLKQIIGEWENQDLTFSQFKTRGELLFKGIDISEIIVKLEDSLMILSSLLSNRYNAPFKAKIQEWNQKLSGSIEIIEQLLQVQNLWVYLEAVFVGGDIAKQLPQEAKRFSNIDKSWQKIMQKAHETTNVVKCCMGDDMYSQLLPHLLEQLEICQKSLTGYLEAKRLLFPRFFFVSDPALLEILGQASNCHTIQDHLLSLFDNVKEVVFDTKVYEKVLAMRSQEGEEVDMVTPVICTGNVETWLNVLMNTVHKTVHTIVRRAWQNLGDSGFDLLRFEDTFCAQVGLLGIQLLWTRDAENALNECRYDREIMKKTNDYFLELLNTLIDKTTQELTKLDRVKFETLITIHVHQRDIFNDMVQLRLKVRTPNDFEWQKQCRFYYDEDFDKCRISVTDVDFTYCDEYTGCTDRLVITPLTDRCYITLAQALGMDLGGAPAGPAGTGKTETTKDMGKCLGKYVVVFNCSDQMDFRGLGRIYKGLAQSGSWGCFDEFNRIELPVLSVAAQQIAIVLAAKKMKKTQFVFSDGDTVPMNPEFGLFITMNPGYAGRQELPENLKINFRSCAMMVPDRQIIMRVKLASAGFRENQELSGKFFSLYQLCLEQLSKQVHYDFGLRNILSVLRTLGAEKRKSPTDPEIKTVMRVLRDMNMSKLVDEDEPLFLSLIDDLFPNITLEVAGYPKLEEAIATHTEEAMLELWPQWKLKVIQLYETQRVRHGMMVLGPSGAGKTTNIHTLMKAMGTTNDPGPHREVRMNPKAITAPQMFGTLDVATNDWTDGIFSTLWRRSYKKKKGENMWLVLDGPVDAIWIENLNSVLDDSKTLTLANGDRIRMAPNTKIIFEPHNIDNASPATVSRNGMVFMSSSSLTWQPILGAWLKTIPMAQGEALRTKFEMIWDETLLFLKQSCLPKMDLLDCMYIRQAIDLLIGLLPTQTEDFAKLKDTHLNSFFIFALMWSLGALLELDDRAKLEGFWRENQAISKMLPVIKGDQTIFEFVPRNDSGSWEPWSVRVDKYDYPTDSIPDFNKILIPNVDNVRTDFLMDLIMKQEKAVLLIGEQGTAKTVMIQGYMSKYNIEEHVTKALNFSSTTTPGIFQQSIESYVEKRVGTTFGPAAGKKMTVFIDDVNMPQINEWNDQITNEIVRQLMENKGFYNLEKPGDFIKIVDVQIVAAMIHPGRGRNDIPQRLKRQFNIFNCTLPSNNSIDQIFKTIGMGYFCGERGFSEDVSSMIDPLVGLTRDLWQKTKVKMLPTPDKFHYIFNLRDLSRVWQGMLTIKSDECSSKSDILSLWRHECTRVISDRFVSQKDRDWLDETADVLIGEKFGESAAGLMAKDKYFVDFMREAPEPTGDEPDDFDFSAPKIYEASTIQQLQKKLLEYQDVYNESIRGAGMNLVFFEDAVTHMVKISRVIRTPRGAAMLVGVGGSGKQSLTRLASHISGYKTFQITLSKSYNAGNLLEDLKLMYLWAGRDGQGVTFIFTDNEIKEESFLEYLNNVIATGEISGLFPKDEMDSLLGEMIPIMKKEFPRHPPTQENLYEYFITRVRSNLHIVLCFSPVGEQFRTRSLKFPGLFSGCTMDWFFRWPKEALVQVAGSFMNDKSFRLEATEEIKGELVDVMGQIQDMVSEICDQYFDRFRRRCHVTPKSFLSFLSGYKMLYAQKLAHLSTQRERMTTGLLKLAEAEEVVGELSIELEQKEKDLAVASAEADIVLKEVDKEKEIAGKTQAEVKIIADKAQALKDSIAADKAVAEKKLELAEPALQAAEKALLTIKPAHIATVKKLGKPPHLIMRIMDCVLILMGKPLNPITPDPDREGMIKPSWNESLKLMSDPKFLSMLLEFNKDTITDEMIDMLGAYFRAEDYNLESAKKVSGDVAGLCTWTLAMSDFFKINKEVLPLKAALAIQEAKLGKAEEELAGANEQLAGAEAALKKANDKYDAAMGHKKALEDDAASCQKKMDNASALIDGLGGEKIAWGEAESQFSDQIRRLVGDVLLANGFLSYSGPFNQEFRSKLLDGWRKKLNFHDIPFTEDLNLIKMLVDDPTIGEWNLQGLPSDELSIQNGIIVTSATRFPLLIDPQGQGKIWIKNREKENDLKITNLNHKYFRQHLEDALSLGQPLLIEDVGEEIDPALDNVLEKNFIKSGSTLKPWEIAEQFGGDAAAVPKVMRCKVGDKECDVLPTFRLYLTTKLANPSYTPEVYARTAIIDFTVTMKGLEDQLLARVILREKSELETERVSLLEDVTANKRKKQELEDNLLYRLTSTQGSLVEDDDLIEVLRISKITAAEVKEKLDIAADTEIKINNAREEYRPVAIRGSIMYFLIVEMSLVNVMYQTSLKQFLVQFDLALERSKKSPITGKRIANIIEYLTEKVFLYTARGFYEADKFLYALLLTLKIDLNRGKISFEQFNTFIKGGASLDLNSVDPKPKKWILDSTWLNLVQLSRLPSFSQLLIQVTRNDKAWKSWFDSAEPEETTLPDGYQESLDIFSKLLLIRSWAPDRTTAQARKYITDSMGPVFADAVILSMDAMYIESDKRIPLLCFLSLGSDPTESIEKLAKQNNTTSRAISMGQGQEVHARRLLAQSFEDGGWILLQNCHLGLNYMDELLDQVTTNPNVHENFRCWITTEPHPKFPINLLQNSIKYTAEPPQGLRAGLKRTYNLVTTETLELSNMPQWKPMLFTTAFLHTIVQERRKFGPLGWNIPYEFNQSDYNSAVQYVQNHLDDMDIKKGPTWKAVQYMFGEILYGGRVTDDLDKILLNTYCSAWMGDHMLKPEFKFKGEYIVPQCKTVADYHTYIDNLPLADSPEVFGLHKNADITYQTKTANSTLSTIVSIQPKESGGGSGESRETVVYRQAEDMLSKVPADFSPFEVKQRLQKMGRFDPMNIFLRQEIDRLQRVIASVRITCSELRLAIDGTIIMSEQLQDALNQIYDARIPKVWAKISWDSSSLGFWFTELLDRYAQLSSWIFEKRPNCFWLTGFFNPQGFLTAMRQETTRAHSGWALDKVKLTNDITKMMLEDVTGPPPSEIGGIYIHGLFVDGAGWDRKNMRLTESSPKVLYNALPVAHVYAINSSEPQPGAGGKKGQQVALYKCPVYKKPRRTDLTFIFFLMLRTTKNPDWWTLRGVATLCDTK